MSITKTLFSSNYGYFRAIVAMVLGLILVIWSGLSIKIVVLLAGAVLLVVGVATLIVRHQRKKNGVPDDEQYNSNVALVNGILDIVLGILFLAAVKFITKLFGVLFGALLVVLAVVQLFNLISASRKVIVAKWIYALPIATLILGVVCICRPNVTVNALAIIFGLGLLVFGASELVSTMKIQKAKSILQEEKAVVEELHMLEAEQGE